MRSDAAGGPAADAHDIGVRRSAPAPRGWGGRLCEGRRPRRSENRGLLVRGSARTVDERSGSQRPGSNQGAVEVRPGRACPVFHWAGRHASAAPVKAPLKCPMPAKALAFGPRSRRSRPSASASSLHIHKTARQSVPAIRPEIHDASGSGFWNTPARCRQPTPRIGVSPPGLGFSLPIRGLLPIPDAHGVAHCARSGPYETHGGLQCAASCSRQRS
jgi:hypothetical protein